MSFSILIRVYNKMRYFPRGKVIHLIKKNIIELY